MGYPGQRLEVGSKREDIKIWYQFYIKSWVLSTCLTPLFALFFECFIYSCWLGYPNNFAKAWIGIGTYIWSIALPFLISH